MRNINRIIIHCTATFPGQKVDAATIRRWHLQQGYKNIGYHYVITEGGEVQTGRPIEETGAHCLGLNTGSIGVVYCGGLDSSGKAADTRNKAQKDALKGLIVELCAKYNIKYISGHNQHAAKACPCFFVPDEYEIKNGQLICK